MQSQRISSFHFINQFWSTIHSRPWNVASFYFCIIPYHTVRREVQGRTFETKLFRVTRLCLVLPQHQWSKSLNRTKKKAKIDLTLILSPKEVKSESNFFCKSVAYNVIWVDSCTAFPKNYTVKPYHCKAVLLLVEKNYLNAEVAGFPKDP